MDTYFCGCNHPYSSGILLGVCCCHNIQEEKILTYALSDIWILLQLIEKVKKIRAT